MAGNILSRALLSIFMDKEARAKYDALQKVKRQAADGTLGKEPIPTPPPPAADTDGDLDILPETLVQRAIEEAGRELERKKNLPPERRALIEQALSIHDQKSALLDDLPKEQREKLVLMAMHAFGDALDSGKSKKTKTAAKKKKP
jgi:hypothetical protein